MKFYFIFCYLKYMLPTRKINFYSKNGPGNQPEKKCSVETQMVSIQATAKLVLHLWSSQWNYWPNNKQECQRHLFSVEKNVLDLFTFSSSNLYRHSHAHIHTNSHFKRKTKIHQHRHTEIFPRLLNLYNLQDIHRYRCMADTAQCICMYMALFLCYSSFH